MGTANDGSPVLSLLIAGPDGSRYSKLSSENQPIRVFLATDSRPAQSKFESGILRPVLGY